MIATSAAAIYQSPDYPGFPKTASNCIKNITTTPGQYLLVYLNSAIFIGSNTKLVIVDFDNTFNRNFAGLLMKI
jgi:hypothetical protein